jgi:hypothetical protein
MSSSQSNCGDETVSKETSNAGTETACGTSHASKSRRVSNSQVSTISPQPQPLLLTAAQTSVYFLRPAFCTQASRVPSVDHAGNSASFTPETVCLRLC